jgi:hypothetical protein
MKFPLLGFILLLTFARTGFAQDFVHPGSWITQAGCDRISSNVAAGKEPWASAWKALKNSDAQADYKPNSNTAVTNSYAMQNDGHAAWVLSVKWIASGDKSYADAAIRILNAWSSKTAVPDDTLRTGLGATQMINGAAGWDPADATKFEEFCKNLLYPVVKKNGGGGWGTPCLSALVAMGVFCNDHAIYELGKSMYMENRRETDPGCDKSCLREYIFDNGQNGDTYRDQGHSMGALAPTRATAASGRLTTICCSRATNMWPSITWAMTSISFPTSTATASTRIPLERPDACPPAAVGPPCLRSLITASKSWACPRPIPSRCAIPTRRNRPMAIIAAWAP